MNLLFTEENLKGIPALYAQDGKGDKAVAHLAITLGNENEYVWLITEYSEEEQLFFGFACLDDVQNAELGYISKIELEDLAKKYPLKIEKIKMRLDDAKSKYINE